MAKTKATLSKHFLARASTKGFGVSSFDRSTGVQCPRIQCSSIVVYNGNYFCPCGWAAPDSRRLEAEEKYMQLLYDGLKVFSG